MFFIYRKPRLSKAIIFHNKNTSFRPEIVIKNGELKGTSSIVCKKLEVVISNH
jgi:hypothetical protein